MPKKIADFSKLPFMLKSTLDHLNFISENDASWCPAAEAAVSNLETEHGITMNGSREPNSFVSSTVSGTSGYRNLDQYSTQLFFLIMRHFSDLMLTLSSPPWLTSMEKK